VKILGVVKEKDPEETRVAIVPQVLEGLKNKNIRVLVEKGAGIKSGFFDADYEKAGAMIIDTEDNLIKESDIIVAINASFFTNKKVGKKILIGLFNPYNKKTEFKSLTEQETSVISLELIPRIARAQSIDVLSSQANIAGYIAVMKSQEKLNKIMPMLITSAGNIAPAKILVIGAGVAGLSAIATARRLGALVYAYDVRKAVKEQTESLGAKFLNIDLEGEGDSQGGYAGELSKEAIIKQKQILLEHAKEMDVIITTALIPGKKAPLLFDEKAAFLLKNGCVVIDMASSGGGNFFGSVSYEWRFIEKVWVYGGAQLARFAPKDASFTFSKNIEALLSFLFIKETDDLNIADDLIKEMLICYRGQLIKNL